MVSARKKIILDIYFVCFRKKYLRWEIPSKAQNKTSLGLHFQSFLKIIFLFLLENLRYTGNRQTTFVIIRFISKHHQKFHCFMF